MRAINLLMSNQLNKCEGSWFDSSVTRRVCTEQRHDLYSIFCVDHVDLYGRLGLGETKWLVVCNVNYIFR